MGDLRVKTAIGYFSLRLGQCPRRRLILRPTTDLAANFSLLSKSRVSYFSLHLSQCPRRLPLRGASPF
ncbi:MAG: hypothetical protein WC763_06780 [Candidatus Paceibacterota bacterium]|jgi:hypothetical protein